MEQFEFRLRRRDGQELWALSTNPLVRDPLTDLPNRDDDGADEQAARRHAVRRSHASAHAGLDPEVAVSEVVEEGRAARAVA